MPPYASDWPWAVLLASVTLASALGFALLAVRDHRRRKQRAAIVFSCVLAVVSGVGAMWLGGVAYAGYVSEHTWSYSYDVSLYPNGTDPESVVLPMPVDEGLLAGLHLRTGSANWSFVDTAHGRGLYVRFTGSTALSAIFREFPASSHNTSFTMTAPGNESWERRSWIFHDGGGGTRIVFMTGGWTLGWIVDTWLRTGWAEYDLQPGAVP